MAKIRTSMDFEIMFSFRFVGLRFNRSGRSGSRPSVKAGGPSIMMLIHKSSSAVNGAVNPARIDAMTTTTEETFTVSWN